MQGRSRPSPTPPQVASGKLQQRPRPRAVAAGASPSSSLTGSDAVGTEVVRVASVADLKGSGCSLCCRCRRLQQRALAGSGDDAAPLAGQHCQRQEGQTAAQHGCGRRGCFQGRMGAACMRHGHAAAARVAPQQSRGAPDTLVLADRAVQLADRGSQEPSSPQALAGARPTPPAPRSSPFSTCRSQPSACRRSAT